MPVVVGVSVGDAVAEIVAVSDGVSVIVDVIRRVDVIVRVAVIDGVLVMVRPAVAVVVACSSGDAFKPRKPNSASTNASATIAKRFIDVGTPRAGAL